MSHATFADRNSAIELTGSEVRNIGHLAEAALTDALSTGQAAPVRRAIGWNCGESMPRFLSGPAAKIMIGDRGRGTCSPWP
jgi:hypothetical protein